MDLFERRRNLLGGKKKFYLYQAGWTNVQNSKVINGQAYAFQTNYLLIDPQLNSSYAFARMTIGDITDLSSYKKLYIRYYCNVNNGDIHVGQASMAGGVYGNVINGTIVPNTITTMSFDTNNVWKYVYFGGSNAAPSTLFRIYEIWLEK